MMLFKHLIQYGCWPICGEWHDKAKGRDRTGAYAPISVSQGTRRVYSSDFYRFTLARAYAVRKSGKWAIVHRCKTVLAHSFNQIAADDNLVMLMVISVKLLIMAFPPPDDLDQYWDNE